MCVPKRVSAVHVLTKPRTPQRVLHQYLGSAEKRAGRKVAGTCKHLYFTHTMRSETTCEHFPSHAVFCQGLLSCAILCQEVSAQTCQTPGSPDPAQMYAARGSARQRPHFLVASCCWLAAPWQPFWRPAPENLHNAPPPPMPPHCRHPSATPSRVAHRPAVFFFSKQPVSACGRGGPRFCEHFVLPFRARAACDRAGRRCLDPASVGCALECASLCRIMPHKHA